MKSQPIETWWTPWQLQMVDDRSKSWIYKKFQPSDGVWEIHNGAKMLRRVSNGEQLPGDAVIEKNAWDHEHCALCDEKIMESPNTSSDGFTDENNWLCVSCYNQYIIPRLE